MIRSLELLHQRVLRDTNAHRGQLVAAFRNVVPDQNVAVQAVHLLPVLGDRRSNPIIVVRGAHFVRITVLQSPADADDEDSRVLFGKDLGLALLARQIRIHVQEFFGVEEGQFLGEVRILRVL